MAWDVPVLWLVKRYDQSSKRWSCPSVQKPHWALPVTESPGRRKLVHTGEVVASPGDPSPSLSLVSSCLGPFFRFGQ